MVKSSFNDVFVASGSSKSIRETTMYIDIRSFSRHSNKEELQGSQLERQQYIKLN
jgi:hypothetical protein